MYYNIKLTDSAVKNLRKLIGIDAQQINLATGIIKVSDLSAVKEAGKRFEIDNVNFKSYEEIVGEPVELKELSQKERVEIIGRQLELGCIIRVMTEGGLEHAAIASVEDGKYTVAKIELRKCKNGSESEIPLRKDVDVIYRNMTYKNIVTLTNQIARDLVCEDFLQKSGGLIVGRIVNQQILDLLTEWAEEAEEDNTEDQVTTEDQGSEEKNYSIFENALEQATSVEDLFTKLQIGEYCLRVAADKAVEIGSFNLKKVIPLMQRGYFQNSTQTGIKNMLDMALEEWANKNKVQMNEYTVRYFLSEIVSKLK